MTSLLHVGMERSESIRDFIKRFGVVILVSHRERRYSDAGSEISRLSQHSIFRRVISEGQLVCLTGIWKRQIRVSRLVKR